jgi:hypothetical protein
MVVQAYNPSYSEGGDQKDHSWQDPMSTSKAGHSGACL